MEKPKPPTGTEPTYTIPGAYGKPSQQFTAGEGRLARPRFRYTGTVSFGYDDNVFQAPSNNEGSPDVVVQVLDRPATSAREEVGIGPNGETTTVTIPGTAATTRKIVIPGSAGQKRIGSFLTRGNVGLDVQFASRKTLFTFDLRTGADWYWDRPGKDVDYTGSLSLLYLRRLTPRLQFTASGTASYQTQPDLTQVNTSTRQTGPLLNLSSKLDLSYRITPRLSTVGSINYGGLRYQEATEQLGDYDTFTFGEEVRYLFSPRFTFLGEVRYSTTSYTGARDRDSHTLFGLLGTELALSRLFTATVRIGVAQRTFDESGISATSPYGEATLAYRLAKATVIQFNGRFGFEEPPDAQSKLVSLRVGLSLSQSFSPRLRGTLGSNVVRQTTTSDVTDIETVTNTVDSTIGFEYTLDRRWTLNANYSYVREFGSNSARDYYRNRIFVGAEYDF
ncbi:MAG: outer membrane beta-barrel protein [Chthoniobacter sp.]|nr:outer membrane beta-barrel protein [Chthoniobacter sp.]